MDHSQPPHARKGFTSTLPKVCPFTVSNGYPRPPSKRFPGFVNKTMSLLVQCLQRHPLVGATFSVCGRLCSLLISLDPDDIMFLEAWPTLREANRVFPLYIHTAHDPLFDKPILFQPHVLLRTRFWSILCRNTRRSATPCADASVGSLRSLCAPK